MHIALVVFCLILAGTMILPPDVANLSPYFSPRVLDILLIAGLLMLLVRAVQASRLQRALSELQTERDEWRRQAEQAEQAAKKAEQLQEAEANERVKFEQAFRASQSQVDRQKAEMEVLKSGQNSAAKAVALLGMMQEKGCFLDFVLADADHIPDESFLAAARVVHQGCSQVVRQHFTIVPVSSASEGDAIELGEEFDASEYRLVGAVKDEGPYQGTLVHKGWQIDRVQLPQTPEIGSEGRLIIAQAEVEIHA